MRDRAGERARAQEPLPPGRPPTAYHAVVRDVYDIRRPGGGSSGGDTLDFRVSGPRLYDDARIMENKNLLVDTSEREVLEFDPGGQDEKWFRPPKGFRIADG